MIENRLMFDVKQNIDEKEYINSKDVIVVIPAYNEENSIERVIKETRDFVETVIVCDDGSTDNTEEIIQKMNVHYVTNSEKIGKGAAIRSLFKEAMKYNPEIIITLDADYQHDPKDIPLFVKEMKDNDVDIVVGSRFVKGSNTDISFIRLFGLIVINSLQRLLVKCNIRDTQSGFRAFSRKAFFIITEGIEDGYNTESEQLFGAIKAGLKLSEIPVTIRYKGLVSTSKKHFILHGFQLVFYIIGYFIKQKLNPSEVKI